MYLRDVECPYCHRTSDFDQEENLEQQDEDLLIFSCPRCDLNFVATLRFEYYVANERQAPCLNDGDHKMVPLIGYPDIYKVNAQCEYCEIRDHEVDPIKLSAYQNGLKESQGG